MSDPEAVRWLQAYLEEAPAEPAVSVAEPCGPLLAEFLGRSGLPPEVFGYAELPSDLQLQPALVLKKGPPLPV